MKFTKLDYKGFEEYIVQVSEMPDRLQYRFLFDNGFGASVIKGKIFRGYSYGAQQDLFEMALLEDDELRVRRIKNKKMTPLFDDVVGWLGNDEVLELLEEIRGLK